MKTRPTNKILSACLLVILSVLALFAGAFSTLAADTPTTAPAPPTELTPSRDYRSSRSSRSYSRDSSSRDSSPRAATTAPDDILLKKSIFAKDRKPAAVVNGYTPPRIITTAPVKPPSIPVLIGVMLEDTGYVAYIQDPDSGTIWPFAVGDPLPGDAGSVDDLTLDYMEIAKPGSANTSPTRIFVGQNLAGQTSADTSSTTSPSPAPLTTSSSTSSTTPSSTTSSAPVDTSGLSLEERMKLRAKQQRGQ